MLSELEETAAAIASGGERVRGRLRISVPLLFGQVAMGRLAAEFVRQHPEVRLQVTTDDRAVDMIEEGYDLVIRVDPAPDETLVGRPFLYDRLVVVAAPELSRPTDTAVPVVVRGGDTATSWSVCGPDGPAMVSVDPIMRLSSMVMIRDAVCAGAGAARLPLSLVTRDIADGRLAHWGDVARSDIALWALYPSGRLLNARVEAFLEFLRRSFPTGVPTTRLFRVRQFSE